MTIRNNKINFLVSQDCIDSLWTRNTKKKKKWLVNNGYSEDFPSN